MAEQSKATSSWPAHRSVCLMVLDTDDPLVSEFTESAMVARLVFLEIACPVSK